MGRGGSDDDKEAEKKTGRVRKKRVVELKFVDLLLLFGLRGLGYLVRSRTSGETVGAREKVL